MTVTQNALATGTYTVDASHSRIGFVARHAMVTKVRGAFNDYEAVAEVNGDDLSDTKVRVAVKAATVDTRSEQRDGHLRSADFFDVETYPEISFSSTAVEPVGDDVLRVTGDLTIKSTTRPVTIDFTYEGSAVDPFGNQRVGFEGAVVVNRKDWGLSWNAGLEAGGVLVSEKVTLEFEISAIKTA
jgi:polyisoprenoid-binding protein YceI